MIFKIFTLLATLYACSSPQKKVHRKRTLKSTTKDSTLTDEANANPNANHIYTVAEITSRYTLENPEYTLGPTDLEGNTFTLKNPNESTTLVSPPQLATTSSQSIDCTTSTYDINNSQVSTLISNLNGTCGTVEFFYCLKTQDSYQITPNLKLYILCPTDTLFDLAISLNSGETTTTTDTLTLSLSQNPYLTKALITENSDCVTSSQVVSLQPPLPTYTYTLTEVSDGLKTIHANYYDFLNRSSCTSSTITKIATLPTANTQPPASIAPYSTQLVKAEISSDVTPFQVIVKDQNSNPLENVSISWTLSGPGNIPSMSTLTDASGIATSPILTLGSTPGSMTVTATITANSTLTTTFTITAQAPWTIAVHTNDLQTTTVNTQTLTPFIAIVKDQLNNPLPNIKVSWASTVGSFSASSITFTDSNGLASSPLFTLHTIAGTQNITATINTGSSKVAVFTATGTTASPSKLTFLNQPSDIIGNDTMPDTSVQITDPYGNLILNPTPITLSIGINPSNGTLVNGTSVDAINGLAHFPNLSIDKAGIGYTLVASSTGANSESSNPFNVANQISISGPTTIYTDYCSKYSLNLNDVLGFVALSADGTINLSVDSTDVAIGSTSSICSNTTISNITSITLPYQPGVIHFYLRPSLAESFTLQASPGNNIDPYVFSATNLAITSEIKLTTPGTLNTTLGTNGKTSTPLGLNNDKMLTLTQTLKGTFIGGGFSNNGTNDDFALTQYSSKGLLNLTFGTSGKTTTALKNGTDQMSCLAITPNGMIIAGGPSSNGADDDFAIVRYTPSGILDTTFGTSGKTLTGMGPGNDNLTSMAIAPNGKIIVAGFASNGTNNDFALARFTSSGILDTTFGTAGKTITPIGTGNDQIRGLILLPNGKILVGGNANTGTFDNFAIAQYTSDGQLDTTFGTSGITTTAIGTANSLINAIALTTEGNIITGGNSFNGTNNDFAIARYTSSGILDTTFGTSGITTTSIGTSNDYIKALTLTPSGMILAGGYASNGASSDDFAIARYTSSGILDTTFGTAGKTITTMSNLIDQIAGLVLTPNGIIVAGGYGIATNYDFKLAFYNN